MDEVAYEGRLILIEEPINLAERRPTPHPCEIIYLTDDSDDVMLDSSGSSELISNFAREEEEQALNEEGETIEAEVCQAMADPAPGYLPPYQDPPGIDDPLCPSR